MKAKRVNDLEIAFASLQGFMEHYCLENIKDDEPFFRCDKCKFQSRNGDCLAKLMAKENGYIIGIMW